MQLKGKYENVSNSCMEDFMHLEMIYNKDSKLERSGSMDLC